MLFKEGDIVTIIDDLNKCRKWGGWVYREMDITSGKTGVITFIDEYSGEEEGIILYSISTKEAGNWIYPDYLIEKINNYNIISNGEIVTNN